MHSESHATGRRATRPLLVVALLPAVFLGCGGPPEVEVRTAPPPPPVAAAPPGPVESFQGAVADVDTAAGEIVVAVQIVWTPVLKAERHDRRVVVESGTRWEPAPGHIARLHVGDEVQVEAEELADGRWRAREVHLLDID